MYVSNEARREPWSLCSKIISFCCCLAPPVKVWSFMFLKFALNLHKWSCWDQISLLQRAPVVLWQPSGERPPAKLLTTKWLWTGGLGGSFSTHTITLPLPSPLLLSIVSWPCYLAIPSSFLHPSPFFPFFSHRFALISLYCSFLFFLLSFLFLFSFPFLSPSHSPLASFWCLITAQWTFTANCRCVYKGLSGTFQVSSPFLHNYPVSGSCSNR